LSVIGEIIQSEINKLSERYPMVTIADYVIMPNHIHTVIVIGKFEDDQESRQEQSPCPTLGDLICAFKSITTKKANQASSIPNRKIWQFRYYDHIVRDEDDCLKILQYISENPAKWQDDCYFN